MFLNCSRLSDFPQSIYPNLCKLVEWKFKYLIIKFDIKFIKISIDNLIKKISILIINYWKFSKNLKILKAKLCCDY